MKKIIKNIKDRNYTIGIIGLGYVGLPLIIRFCEEGFKTIGFDVDNEKINMLNSGLSYIKHIDSKKIKKISNNFYPTTDFGNISKVDSILICVPTPLGIHNEPDLSFIVNTLDMLKPHLRENQTLILESTTYPGTTEEEILPIINELGFKVGKISF
jgi:UDP-N-acetyl-D-mannosaminuronate dehydrogenase